MGCVSRFLLVLLLGGLSESQNFSLEEIQRMLGNILEGQNKMQQQLTDQTNKQSAMEYSSRSIAEDIVELKTSLMRITGSMVNMTDMIRDLQENHRDIESAVNATTRLLAEINSSDSILNLEKNISSANVIHNDTCVEKQNSDDLIDRAKDKPTLPLKHWSTLTSQRAVDGDITTQYHSIDKYQPWWNVDLLDTYLIKTIDILPHPEVPGWFRDIKVFIGNSRVVDGDFSAYYMVGSYAGPWDAKDRVVYDFPGGISGRYVAIQGFSGTNFLDLMDVKVMA